MRVLYKCKCGNAKRVDYPHKVENKGAYGKVVRRYYRFDGADSDRIYYQNDPISLCECGKRMAFGVIQGFKTDHVCDDRCTSAKGYRCECSCGGEHHGHDWAA